MKNDLVTQTGSTYTWFHLWFIAFLFFSHANNKKFSNAQEVNIATLWKNEEVWEMYKEKDTKSDPWSSYAVESTVNVLAYFILYITPLLQPNLPFEVSLIQPLPTVHTLHSHKVHVWSTCIKMHVCAHTHAPWVSLKLLTKGLTVSWTYKLSST